MFEQGIYIEALNMSRSFATYESNVLFALRFMIDHEVVGGNWIEFPPNSYTFQGLGHSHKLSHCQLEAHIHCSKLISHKPEGVPFTLPLDMVAAIYSRSGAHTWFCSPGVPGMHKGLHKLIVLPQILITC